MNSENLDHLLDIARNPGPYVTQWKTRTSGKAIGCLHCMPPYVVEEIVHAAGMLPVGIWGTERALRAAASTIEPFACSIARSALDLALSGDLSICDGFVFPSTCDTFQNLGQIWHGELPAAFVHYLVYPRAVHRESSKRYMVEALEMFRRALGAFSGVEITDDALDRAVAAYRKSRALLSRLSGLRVASPSLLGMEEMIAVVRVSSFMDRGEYNEILEDLVASFCEAPAGETTHGGCRLIVAGVTARPGGLMGMIEEAGGTIDGDDLGDGERYFRVAEPARGASPIETLAEMAREALPASTIHDPDRSRARYLVEMAKSSDAEGIILNVAKFCEPELFDVPHLVEVCKDAGLPVLVLESELQMGSLAPLGTRVEAFLESIRAGAPARAGE